MLDGAARRLLEPALDRIGGTLARLGVAADLVTWTGFALGTIAVGLVAIEHYMPGLAFILASRLCDGLDGAVARHSGRTDRGGFLDIVLDFAFYGAVPLAFAVAGPEENAIAAAVLLFSFYVNGTTFLAFAVMAERRGLKGELRGPKSLYFTTGLAEATETILAFCLFCLLPGLFAPLAYAFAALCLATAAARVLLALQTLR